MDKPANPVLVNICRGDIVESTHRGSALVVDNSGQDYLQVGDVERHIYPRSSLKFFQAIPLIETGAAEKFKLSDEQIALACASHSGEQQHISVLQKWFSEQGLSEANLENGPALPMNKKAFNACISQGGHANKFYQNCSGKHAGMLMVAKFLNQGLEGYSQHDHPSQQLWMESLSQLVSLDIVALPWERDGCGLPAIVMPLRGLAQAAVLCADIQSISEPRRSAMARILHAVQTYPQLIAGSDRCCTAVIEATAGNVVVKTGAEGVYMGAVLDKKLGFALKMDSGLGVAAEVALGGLLNKLGVLSGVENEKLRTFFRPDIINSQQYRTGCVAPADNWASF